MERLRSSFKVIEFSQGIGYTFYKIGSFYIVKER